MQPGVMDVGRVVLSSLLVILSASCAISPVKVKDYGRGYHQVGTASWYGPGFHGKKTSSGEVFDMHGFTAAHRTMPFGTTLKVKNRENGRWTQVKVNDRGPFVRGRILDLSYGAAKELDMIGTGTALVEIQVVGSVVDNVRPAREKKEPGYTVQVGAFIQRENALKLKAQLEERYQQVYIRVADTSDQRYYRVRVGRLPTEEQADQLASRLNAREKLETFVVRED
jgi:rare lipoprotein A